MKGTNISNKLYLVIGIAAMVCFLVAGSAAAYVYNCNMKCAATASSSESKNNTTNTVDAGKNASEIETKSEAVTKNKSDAASESDSGTSENCCGGTPRVSPLP